MSEDSDPSVPSPCKKEEEETSLDVFHKEFPGIVFAQKEEEEEEDDDDKEEEETSLLDVSHKELWSPRSVLAQKPFTLKTKKNDDFYSPVTLILARMEERTNEKALSIVAPIGYENPKKAMEELYIERLASDVEVRIGLFNAILDYNSQNGRYPFDHSTVSNDFIKNWLQVDVSQSRLLVEIQSLRNEYLEKVKKNHSLRSLEGLGPRYQVAFELADKLWGIIGSGTQFAGEKGHSKQEGKGLRIGQMQDLSKNPVLVEEEKFLDGADDDRNPIEEPEMESEVNTKCWNCIQDNVPLGDANQGLKKTTLADSVQEALELVNKIPGTNDQKNRKGLEGEQELALSQDERDPSVDFTSLEELKKYWLQVNDPVNQLRLDKKHKCCNWIQDNVPLGDANQGLKKTTLADSDQEALELSNKIPGTGSGIEYANDQKNRKGQEGGRELALSQNERNPSVDFTSMEELIKYWLDKKHKKILGEMGEEVESEAFKLENQSKYYGVDRKDLKGKEEQDLSQYPFFRESLKFEDSILHALMMPVLGESFVKEGLGLIGRSEMEELNNKWKKLQIGEAEFSLKWSYLIREQTQLFLKRVDLINEQTKLLLDAMKSSSSSQH